MAKELIKFHATWCQPCKMLAKNLEQVDMGLHMRSVDIDAEREVAEVFKVRGVPTLILVEDGIEIDRKVGMQSTAELNLWKESYMIADN